MHYVYFLQNESGRIYYGCTGDLKRRLKEHKGNRSFSTKNHSWKLIYYEAYLAEADAWEREKQLKRHGQALAKLRRRIKNSLEQISAG